MKSLLNRYWWLVAIGLLVLIQFHPYGRDHENPPVYQEIQWPDMEVRALAQRACFDCHSSETVYPWYASIAPISWFIQNDIDTARALINFSDFVAIQRSENVGAVVRSGSMPPLPYLLLHPSANLTNTEREALAQGLEQALGLQK